MTTVISQGSATALPFRDDSIPCIVTSPPYNMGIGYQGYDDRRPWMEYLAALVAPAVREMARVLQPGGRLWVNLPTNAPFATGQENGARMDVSHIWHSAFFNETSLFYRDTVIWKQDGHDGGTQWGSWLKPSAPNLRGEYEVILCLFKKTWRREIPKAFKGWTEPRNALGGDWTDLCRNVWTIQPSREKWSPAPYPLAIPARCIRLSTFPGEVILDPFGGGGTTAEAAHILGRVGISMDISAAQTRLTHSRLTDIFGG